MAQPPARLNSQRGPNRYVTQNFRYDRDNGSAKSSLYSSLTVHSTLPDDRYGGGRSTSRRGGHGRGRSGGWGFGDRSRGGGGRGVVPWTEENLRNPADVMERFDELVAGRGRRGGRGRGRGREGGSGGRGRGRGREGGSGGGMSWEANGPYGGEAPGLENIDGPESYRVYKSRQNPVDLVDNFNALDVNGGIYDHDLTSGDGYGDAGGNAIGGRGWGRSTGRGLGRGHVHVRGRGDSLLGQKPKDPFEVLESSINNINAGDGINFDSYENIPVQSTGNDIPSPAISFDDIELGLGLSQNIKRCGYSKPTPIQCHAIPVAVAGRDLMACAQTGSGKTAGFCLPIIAGIVKAKSSSSMLPHRARMAHPLALIMSPTRELSCQIYEEVKKFAHQTPVRAVVVYGGAPIVSQLREMEKGVDILVATPGRLVDMIERGRVSLGLIRYLALDEADRMLDMGFEPQIRKVVQQSDMPRPGVRQTMLFSATFPSEIQKLAAEFLSNYIFLSVGRVGSSTGLITQRVEFVNDMDKKKHLLNILALQNANETQRQHALILIFMETKRGADELEHWLMHNGFPAIAIHGDKMQHERERALRSFRTGLTPILVATDVAARGLDIPNVAHVINFDFPKDIDSYVHRIGRTGRAGKPGTATAFFNEKSAAIAQSLVELLKEANQEVPCWLQGYVHRSGFSSSSRSQRFSGGSFSSYDFRGEAQTGHHSASNGRNLLGEARSDNHYQHYSSHNRTADPAIQDISDTLVNRQHTSVHDAGKETTAEPDIPESCDSLAVDYASGGCRASSQGIEPGYGNVVATGWDTWE